MPRCSGVNNVAISVDVMLHIFSGRRRKRWNLMLAKVAMHA